MMDLSVPYYEDLTRVSNSNIGWFLKKGPAYLHMMLTNPKEESNSTLKRGTMIHEYLLQPNEFQKDYVVWDKPKPTSTQQDMFCKALANSIEIEPNLAVLSAYKAAYSTRDKKEDKMLSEGLKIASELSSYISFLKSRDKREMITPYDVKILENIKYNIEHHKLARQLLNPKKDDTIEVYHEFHINWEYDFENEDGSTTVIMKCKSLLDSVTFNFKDKVCTIMDLKTTGKLYSFEASMNEYDYCRQLAYYYMACKWYLKNERNENVDDWKFQWYIIGIDVVDTYNVRVFKFTEEQIFSRLNTIYQAIEDIAWHWSNDLWDYSRSYYEGDGSELLIL